MSPLKVTIALFVLFGLVHLGDTPAGQLVCFWTGDPGAAGSQDAPLPGCARVSRPRLDTCKVCEAEEQQVILVCNLSNPRAEVIREADRGEVHKSQRACPALAEEAVTDE